MTPEELFNDITTLTDNGSSVLEAVVDIMIKNQLEAESLVGIISSNSSMVALIESEALSLNLIKDMPKKGRLPI